MDIFNSLITLQLICILCFRHGNAKSSSGETKEISSDDLHSQKFTRFTIHRDQGTVFIGAANRWYKLSSDLKRLANVSTTWNIKNMMINYKDSDLIVCGGALNYWCSSYNLTDESYQPKPNIENHFGIEVSNSTNASIVAFIGDNKVIGNDNGNSKLYVAISYFGHPLNNSALFISTSKPQKGQYAVESRSWKSDVEISHVNYHNAYKVNYVYGFSSGIYNYILTTQLNSVKSGPSYISKLIRICNGADDDKIFQLYTEIPIECGFSNSQSYNLIQAANIGKPSLHLAKSMKITLDDDVLFGVFSKDQNETPYRTLYDNGSLCIYSLKDINEKFTENIQNCYNGKGYRGFNNTEMCIESNENINSDFCSSEVNMPLVGDIPVRATPSTVFNSLPTAITTARRENHTDIFIGTKTGKLINIVLDHIYKGCRKDDLLIDEGSPVNSDLIFSLKNHYLYVMTDRYLKKIKIPQTSICSKYNDFNTCFQNSSLNCGWCEFTDSCTSKCDCFYDDMFWYSYDFRKKVKITQSNSQEFLIGTVKTIQLEITTLPKIHDILLCYFNLSNKIFSTKGSLNQTAPHYNLVSCELPDSYEILTFLKDRPYMRATLSISTPHILDIINTDVKFFGCGNCNTCKNCSTGPLCMWCPRENKCTFKSNRCLKSGPTELESMIFASKKQVLIEFRNVKSYDVCEATSYLKCLITIERKKHPLKIVIEKDNLYCEYEKSLYRKNVSKINASVEIMWETPTFTDVLYKKNVEIYECYLSANECNNCLTLDSKYNCGWCQKTETCKLPDDCANQWLDKHNKCPQTNVAIVANSSPKFQTGAVANIQLNITTVPEMHSNFSCNFAFSDENFLLTNGNLEHTASKHSLVSCEIPRKIPPLPNNEHYLNATLTIAEFHNPFIGNINVTFFDCNTYNSCKACFSSEFLCNWCPKQNLCTYEQINSCLKSNATELKSDMTIASGKQFPLKFSNVKSYDVCETMISNLECLINIEGERMNKTRDAVIKDNMIYCENTTYKYANNASKINSTVEIMWKTPTFNDVLYTKKVVIYKCYLMANECNSCLTLNPEYNCVWCQSSSSCEFQDNCNGQWINHLTICPGSSSPSILSFSPQRGPWEGGTNVTIIGESLGYIFQDINQDIKVAGVTCKPFEDMYIPTKSITCVIKKLIASPENEGPVVVYVNKVPVTSKQNYKFLHPKILDISPYSGPIYGGTELTIRGENLNTGKNIRVLIGNIFCLIFSLAPKIIKCITNSSVEQNAIVRLEFDQNVRNFTNNTYNYVKDPQRDEKGFNIQPKGIPAGGVTILIRNVTSTPEQELIFFLYNKNYTYNSSCILQNKSIIACPSPHVLDIRTDSIDSKKPREMNFSIIDIVSYKQIETSQSKSQKLSLYPNPEFHYFLNSTVEINGESFVIIKGKNINKACQKIDIKVNVGSYSCEVISISSNQLICRLPKFSSSSVNDSEQTDDILANYDEITVSIGNHFNVSIRRESNPLVKKSDKDIIIYVEIIIIAISIVSITLILLFCLNSKKMAAKTAKKLKKTQLQMTRLELRVASECKEAFAELQTQTAAFKMDNFCTNLPFLNYHNYVINILFPNINDHSIILKGKAILIHKEHGLKLFEELIMNKRFLLSFVRALETQGSFSMNDRVYVASMIMITLQKNMEYCTDILKTLLAELIEKNMQGKSHPKLLLRRTESVVEKMLSAWFSFLLYEFLKKSAGQPLFNLFHAIKEHVNKGPVDMITSHARYCLSENKILRLKFDYFPLTIYVNISRRTAKIIGLESAIEKVPVQVLDCDVISQFKEKAVDAIHRTINFSRSLNSIELYVKWFRDTTCTLILSDDDSSSMAEGEWRRKNTLKHYKVPDGSVLSLISDQEMNYRTGGMLPVIHKNELQNNIKFKLEKSILNTRKKSLTESTTALIQSNDLHLKEWHLIKPYDSQVDQEDRNDSYEIIPEIYLTRLLATKSSLQKYVDELFNTIFKKPNQSNGFSIAIKYMFDFLDNEARKYNITDPEVVHVWKNNCLPLRFWVNLIKNPNFLFDAHKSNIVDSCLSVIAQVFMDSCSTSEQNFNKDSATTKLLYAQEIPIYNKLVKKYYADIKNMPRISSQEMNSMLADVSKKYASDIDTNMSIHELFKYATKYKEILIDSLKNDEFSKDNILLLKLEKVMELISALKKL